MEDKQSRELNRAVAGQTVMDKLTNVGKWNLKPAIKNKKDELDASIARVGDIDDEINDTTGNASSKAAAKDVAAKTAWIGAKALFSFGEDTNDGVLRGEIGFSWSELRYGKDTDLVDRWKLVNDRANTHVLALTAGGYGVDAAFVILLGGQIGTFGSWKGKPKAARSDKKSLNVSLDNEIKNLGTIIDSLEDRMVQFALSDADFYNAVIDAFSVDNIGMRHRAIQVTYLDDATGIRLPGVSSKVVELNIVKKSSRVGSVPFPIEEVPQGNYIMESDKPGYVRVTSQNVVAQAGKLTRLVIRMVKA